MGKDPLKEWCKTADDQTINSHHMENQKSKHVFLILVQNTVMVAHT
jgi:hypothetical protein